MFLKMMPVLSGVNKQIDRTHKHALQILYKDYESLFEALLT